MKFSEQWLRSWANPDLSTQALCDQLTMAGLEIDGVEPAAGEFTEVVVAQVESMEKHPDADKLNVCQVNDGTQTLQIVCGAANVRPGLKIPLAKIGAVLPGSTEGEVFRIKPAKLRGVESSGMLCSEKELGLAEQADGLMELAEDAPLGESLRDYLSLDDTIIEIDLTPNRGDCLSIAGIAREVAALNECELSKPEMSEIAAVIQADFPVEVEADEACSHYVARVIKAVNTAAETPLWMLERLRRSGIRSLGAVVDITNYVMLELGQPMHAFDLAMLEGQISVRFAETGEKITLLDGKSIELDAKTLLIADDTKPLALAGVMGGELSGVSDKTTDILLESAFFRPEIIAGKARSYGLHTDSSHRFERGVDTRLQVPAIQRATELILQICGGQPGNVQELTSPSHPPSEIKDKPAIHLRRERISRILGITLSDEEVSGILTRLGLDVTEVEDGWQVRAPGYRFDINIEADLLEELVRVYGYNNIPRIHSRYAGVIPEIAESCVSVTTFKNILVNRGYFEAVTYSFVDPALQALLDPEVEAVALANPISSEMSVMRTTLWPGLLQALKYNVNRQQSRVRLFETGQCFRPDKNAASATTLQAKLSQQPVFGGVICGDLLPEQWAAENQKVDFFDIKGDVEALLSGSAKVTEFKAAPHPALHPGQSACLLQDNEIVGWLGALHPSVAKTLGIEQRVFVFELELSAIDESLLPAFKQLSRFPEVRRDIAILVKEDVAVAELMHTIHASSSDLLVECEIFDIYQGKGVEEGIKSVAFGLILQEFSRTLTDEDVDAEIEKIVSALNKQFAATLRE